MKSVSLNFQNSTIKVDSHTSYFLVYVIVSFSKKRAWKHVCLHKVKSDSTSRKSCEVAPCIFKYQTT